MTIMTLWPRDFTIINRNTPIYIRYINMYYLNTFRHVIKALSLTWRQCVVWWRNLIHVLIFRYRMMLFAKFFHLNLRHTCNVSLVLPLISSDVPSNITWRFFSTSRTSTLCLDVSFNTVIQKYATFSPMPPYMGWFPLKKEHFKAS